MYAHSLRFSALILLVGAASSPALASIPVPTEICDGTDNDFDGQVDEGFDIDGDGVADCFDAEECDGVDNDGDGTVDEGFDSDADGVADCFDVEECDGIDNDGDGAIDEGYDADGDETSDCFDAEECDGLDNDGDGLVDEGYDLDADGIADCFDSEECDGVDNNGDGVVDEGYPDSDGDGVADCVDEPDDLGCTLTQGYWKNHPEVWPVDSLVIGGREYSADELLDILLLPTKGDRSLQIGHQLIAAELNILSGADDSAIAATIAGAQAWMTTYADADGLPYGIKEWNGGEAYSSGLDEYNNGFGGPLHCDDDGGGEPTAESCDGLDNDGDGLVDEDFSDTDGDGIADCYAFETCDGADDDGDGYIDEGYPDTDNDGQADCVDAEECDGVDNNGDGAIDEGFSDADLDGIADCVDSVSEGCTFTQGYWKNHAEAWPVSSLVLGGRTYSQATLLTLLATAPKGDKSLQLSHQLIAAKLSVANGAADDDIVSVFTSADAWLVSNDDGDGLPFKTKTWGTGQVYAEELDDYNNGVSGPGHCAD